MKRWRYYGCSVNGARLGRAGCLLHERKVRAVMERLRLLARGGEA